MMKFNLEFSQLESVFQEAKEIDANYVAVVVEMEGFNQPEIIINHKDNIEQKLDYYRKTYDNNCIHKHAPGIKIIAVMYGNNLQKFEFAYLAIVDPFELRGVKE